MASPQMRAARLHKPGENFLIDRIERPQPRAQDVLVAVKACAIIPAMNAIFSGRFWPLMPPAPASMGLDAAGIVVEAPDGLADIAVGDRVYVDPFLACGSCVNCLDGKRLFCVNAALRGYFAFSPSGVRRLEEYPYGGLCEFLTASPQSLVKLPPEISFAQGARFGYLGTSFAGLRKGGVGAGSWVAINGATGTLGVGAVILALAMGATRIFGFGRNREVLDQVKALAPRRIDTLVLGESDPAAWVRARTEGQGVDLMLDCTGRGSPPTLTRDAMACVRRGGTTINIGGLAEPVTIEPMRFLGEGLGYRGSNWFTVAEGRLMAEMARAGVLDLGVWTPRIYPLTAVNDALEDIKQRPGGFVNIVVAPDQ
ncbi:MAG TPA: zinc-binding dehydrogenase [Stellaceae bacterium]|nr:zinc-binding dehydrogenase [Stellaceae bacterium]